MFKERIGSFVAQAKQSLVDGPHHLTGARFKFLKHVDLAFIILPCPSLFFRKDSVFTETQSKASE
jgi:hypothetical protein